MDEYSGGWQRLWRHQRILWWLFAVNFVLALLAIIPLTVRTGGIAGNSLASDALYHGFDVIRYIELISRPEIGFGFSVPILIGFAVIFFLFMLLVTGGILAAYRTDRKLTTGEFFQAGGNWFWPFLRLMIMFAIVLIPIRIGAMGIRKWSDHLSSDAQPEKLGFWVAVVGGLVVLLLMMCARLWFDMAQVQAVATGKRGMFKGAGRAFKLTFGNFAGLFWLYLRPSLVAFVGMAAILCVWVRAVPSSAVGISFLLLEFGIWLWLLTRLWQRAAETAWYQRHESAVSAAETNVAVPSPSAIPPGSVTV